MTFGLASILGGKLAGRTDRGRRSSPASSLLSAGAFGLSLATAGTSFRILGPLLSLLGFGAGLVAPPMNAAILASVEPGLAGIGSGVLNAGRQIGTALGVAVFASLFVADRVPLRAVQLAMLGRGGALSRGGGGGGDGTSRAGRGACRELRSVRPERTPSPGFTGARRARVPRRAPATPQAEENAGVGRRARAGRRDHGRLRNLPDSRAGRELRSGGRALTFVAWALGGAVGLLGALIFAELATRHPHAGGKYVYARESFGRRAGFVVGWVEALTYCAAVAAIAVVVR